MKPEPIEFEVSGLTLRGNFYQAAEPKDLAMLFLHGWTGIPNELAAERLAKNGFSAMTFSLSGHNNSDGKLEDQTRNKSLREILAAYDLLKSNLPANTKIGLASTSYTSYLGAILSKERPLACLQLRSPALFPDEHWGEPQINFTGDNPTVRSWRDQPRKFSESRALKALHDFREPIQVMESGNDEMLTHLVVQNYIDAISDKKQLDYHLMEGWPHSLGLDPERNQEYQEILLNWLNKLA